MLEKDVETALIKWMDHEYTPFLGRQIKTPAGIIDCMFWDVNAAQPMVVEVKRGRTPPILSRN